MTAPLQQVQAVAPNSAASHKTRAFPVVKVIASDVRKGNVLENEDGKLYTVLKAETYRPGKGTPTATIEMRRISDGVKVVETYKTTDQLERAFVEEVMHTYLFKDDPNYVFMNPENYEQITVPAAMLGDDANYLDENMQCHLLMFDGSPVAISLPQRVTLEIVETEPVVKGQTASGSYKPAKLSNGVRVMVPPHIGTGTRIIVSTEDGSYVERAKD
jgi:elongation factor P